jgi:hypothetical protein
MDLRDVALVVVVVLSCGFVSTTISMTHVFRNLRAAVMKHSGWAGRLVSCPYCLGTWSAATYVAVGAAAGAIPPLPWWGYFLGWTALSGGSAIVSGLLCHAMCCMMDLAERPSLLE